MADTKDEPEQAEQPEAAQGEDAKAESEAPSDSPAWRQQLDQYLEEIKGNLTEAGENVQTDAKETWKKMGPQLEHAEKTLKEAAGAIAESLEGFFGQFKKQSDKPDDKA